MDGPEIPMKGYATLLQRKSKYLQFSCKLEVLCGAILESKTTKN